MNSLLRFFETELVAMAAIIAAAACSNEKPQLDEPDDPRNHFEEEADDKSPDLAGTFDYAALRKMKHPRLLMAETDWDVLKEKVKNSEVMRILNREVMAIADKCVDNKPVIEYKLDASDKRLLTQSRLAEKDLLSCAYAFKMTGQPKYLDRVRSVLKVVCGFKDWHPSHFLDVAEMALGVSIAYDWLYYDLPLQDRKLAHKALADYALIPYQTSDFGSGNGNWNQVCYSGLSCAAIALYEKDKTISRIVLEGMAKDNARAMSKMYAPDGNYPEGYMYWNYGTWFETVLLAALDHAFGNTAGIAESPGFLRTADYILFMEGVTDGCFAYSDCSTDVTACPAMFWFASYRNEPSLLANEIRKIKAGGYSDRMLALAPVLALPLDLSKDMSVTGMPEFWSGNGTTPVALVHTGWKFDSNDKYLGIKGGKASSGHGHMDAGSFVYDAYGVRWSTDLGHQTYTSVEKPLAAAGGAYFDMAQSSLRWDVLRCNNLCHSTLSAYPKEYYPGERGKQPSGMVHASDHKAKGAATIMETYPGHGKLGAKLNMTDVLSQQVESATRSICLEGEKLVVTDFVKAKPGKPVVLEWRMVSPSGNSMTPGPDGIKITNGGTTMKLSATGNIDGSAAVPEYHVWTYTRPDSWTVQTWDKASGALIAGYSVEVPGGSSITLVTELAK